MGRSRSADTQGMSDFIDPPPVPETPWEFYPDDDLREEPGKAAEDEAMHVEFVQALPTLPIDEPGAVVHYMDDEDPEIPDTSIPPAVTDVTPEVEDLLIQQHYMSAESDS